MRRPSQWRDVLRPWYWDEFRPADELGLHVFFHTCGDVWEVIPLADCGKDHRIVPEANVTAISDVFERYARSGIR